MRGWSWLGVVMLAGCVEEAAAPEPHFTAPATAAGASRTCVVSDDAVYVRGEDRAGFWYPEPRALEGVAGPFLDLSCGDAGGCVVSEDGGVTCWQDERGVYAMDSWTLSVDGATRVASANDITCVIAGDDVVCDIRESEVWGEPFSAIGSGEVVVKRIVGATDLAVSELHACAIDHEGDVWCFGLDLGQLPGGSRWDSQGPKRVEGVEDARRISVSDGQGCALTGAGEAWCWGGHMWYQEPRKVADRVVSVVTAPLGEHDDHLADTLCTLDALGRVACGSSSFARGIEVVPGITFASITGGNQQACGWTDAGELWCWGHGVVEPGVWSERPVRVDVPE